MPAHADPGPFPRTVGALLLAALWLPSPAARGGEAVWKAIFRGTAEVNVVNVDVVVTDAGGNPVTGLTREDFELYDGKERLEISNFFAVEDGEPVSLATQGGHGAARGASASAPVSADAPAAQPLSVIVLVDNVNLDPTHRARVFGQVRDFLLENRQATARVMLASNDRALVVRQGFTSVPHEIFVAFSELEKTAAPSPRFDAERRELLRAIERVNVESGSGLFATKDYAGHGLVTEGPSNIEQRELTYRTAAEAQSLFPQIQAYSQQRTQHTLASLRVLRELVDVAAGLPGRKAVLYVSDGLSLKPGEAIYEAFSRRFEALADVGARIHVQAEAARDDATAELQALVDHASASRVAFYTLDASPAESLSYGAAESDHGSGGNFGAWNDSMASTEEQGEQHALRLMAQDTGGRFGHGPASWDAALEGMLTDAQNYYSLGFVADAAEARGPRRLEVKVPGREVVVRHRSSFRDKPVTERTTERTRAALVIDATENPFGVEVAAAAPRSQDDGTFLVPLEVRIPLGRLVLLPGESEHQGRVSMFVAVRDERGRTSPVNRHLCPIRIPNAEVLTALGRSAACGLRLRMRPGPQRIALSVLDELTAVDSTVHLALDVGAARRAELESSR